MTAAAHRNRAPDQQWMAQAACRDQDAQLFIGPDSDDDILQALATCATCRVRATCLTTALHHSNEADAGIWGGTTEEARRHIRSGDLTLEEALASPETGLRQQADSPALASLQARSTPPRPRPPPPPRITEPEVTVARDANGDYASADGRVLIFRIHGDRPWALAIDNRCITATRTVTEARRIAWTTLHAAEQHRAPPVDRALPPPRALRR